MNALKKLSQVKPNKPYHGFSKLDIGFYRIECFRVVKNKFGKKSEGSAKSILAELKNEVVFLPQYFWDKIDEEDINELNLSITAGEEIYLHFGGRNEESK